MMTNNVNVNKQHETIKNYYTFQSKIYDLTRWSFLFGRNRLVRSLPIDNSKTNHVAEIGSGTGKNLKLLVRRYPSTYFTGVDVSRSMLERAERRLGNYDDRVNLLHMPYTKGKKLFPRALDGIIFSYSLSMINPQWKELVDQAISDLKEGGFIGVVDFYDSKRSWFKDHMSHHHVRMDGHIVPYLQKHLDTKTLDVKSAYMGTWSYFIYIGTK